MKSTEVQTEIHVAPSGSDKSPGTDSQPLRSISAAANLAMPGTRILIHSGIYRERVDPPRGGDSDQRRISFEPFGNGAVEIRGSEILTGWEEVGLNVWKVAVPDDFFGDFHPYREPLRGHWFNPKGRVHHAGAVFAGDHWLAEAAGLVELDGDRNREPRWFCRNENGITRFWAEFPDRDPNDGSVEITARQTVFYPSREGCDFITVRGLILSRAATPWSPPTTEQIGLLGTNWSKGWVIENNIIRHSCCAGITLGKYHDPEDHPESDVVEGTGGKDTYHGTILRALVHGWSTESVGNHLVKGNEISHCEMAGICGSLGAVRSLIEGNIIHHIHVRRLFGGFEQAGIKFHGAIDTVIARNRIFLCALGIWLDWMSQGTRVTGNLLHDNGRPDDGSEPMPPEGDLFTEVNHGPTLFDHNLLLSPRSLTSWSEGGAYVRNLFLGRIVARAERGRVTPYHIPHGTEVAGMESIGFGDDCYLGNVFAHPDGLSAYTGEASHMTVRGNLYLGGARPSTHDQEVSRDEDFPIESVTVAERDGRVEIAAGRAWRGVILAPSSSAELPQPQRAAAPFETTEGAPVDLCWSWDGTPHSDASSGPFSCRPEFPLVVWPPGADNNL